MKNSFIALLLMIFSFCTGFSTGLNLRDIKINKELKEIKMTVDNVESQLKILVPPPEFMQLPITRDNKK